MGYWLVKSDPEEYGWDNLVHDKFTSWTGVRNHQARNHLATMKKGDMVLFYHSQKDKAIVGIAKVTKEAYPDPTAGEGNWLTVDLAPLRKLKKPVTLETIKSDKRLTGMPLIRQSRLSVMPVKKEEYDIILTYAG
ncbi:MAG: ubiquinol-cytochrome c reductase [Chitinophagales bacterium]|nr:MAG: ubiquinol-cytochrome c reductase [Chitinophagales bacterium]